MKLYSALIVTLTLSFSAFARTTDPRCDIGFDMKIAENHQQTYTQYRGLFNETTRQLFAKGYDLKILDADKAANKLSISYAPVSFAENSATCAIATNANILNYAVSDVTERGKSGLAHMPKVDPVFDICWDLITEKIKSIPDCPYKAR